MITIPISDERLVKLQTRAKQAGVAPEEFLSRRVDQFLDEPDKAFRQVSEYVLKKNAELYRRLAQ